MTAIHTMDEKNKNFIHMLVNPKLLAIPRNYICRWVKGAWIDRVVEGYVMRYKRISRHLSIKGWWNRWKVRLRLKGYPAIVAQHEIDHLNGILFLIASIRKSFHVPDGAQPFEFEWSILYFI